MYKLCVFGGTTEGRELVEFLNTQPCRVTACVATEYGQTLLPEGENLTVSARPLPVGEIGALLQAERFDLVIDATHPYAASITKSIAAACEAAGVEHWRLLRGASEAPEDAVFAENTDEAVRFLSGTEGNILLTTGSKELSKFAALPDFAARCWARVLPLPASLEACGAAGLSPSHIFALQGPFSREMDEAMLHRTGARWLVTKDGGAAGGFQEKAAAARHAGARLLVIGRPTQETGSSLPETIGALCALGLFDNGSKFRPNDVMTRAEFIDLLVRTKPISGNSAGFPDVSSGYWAASQIQAAASHGWISGFPDGTFRPNSGLTRAEACTVVNNMLGRTGDAAQATRLIALGLYSDVSASYWGARTIAEASVSHTAAASGSGESWNGVDVASMTFTPGFHAAGNQLYYVAWTGKLVTNTTLGAYKADATGALTQTAKSYQMANVPYISQIDNIYAWVGCEAVADLMGLKAKGYAQDVTIKYFLDNLPRSKSDPEKGFVGSPYVPDTSKRTRTTIYPAKLAEYSNTYCGSDDPCADFRGASVTDLQRELLAGNCVVGYMTLWWASPYYRTYNIEGTQQRLVSNNHAVLVCGYDPNKGYYISDPYNYYNRGQVHQYWENAKTFEAIWNARKVGMVIR